MTGQNLEWEARMALQDKRLSSEVKVRPISKHPRLPKASMTMDEVREIDRKRREAFLAEWAPILEVMES